MVKKSVKDSLQQKWAYAYELVPPQRADRLRLLKTLLDNEQAEARREARTWAGSLVSEQQVTHILVVSDSPGQDHAANKRLEAKLKELKAEFSITASMIIADDA